MSTLESRIGALVDALYADGSTVDGSDVMEVALTAARIGAELEREKPAHCCSCDRELVCDCNA